MKCDNRSESLLVPLYEELDCEKEITYDYVAPVCLQEDSRVVQALVVTHSKSPIRAINHTLAIKVDT